MFHFFASKVFFMMKKQLLLSFCLIGLMGSETVQATGDAGELIPTLVKGACVLIGGGWAFERLKNSYNDYKKGRHQSTDLKEDLKNVAASTICTAMFVHAGGGDSSMIKKVLGSGTVLGSVYLGLKRFGAGSKELRLREFVLAVAACGIGREGLKVVGIPVFKFDANN